VNREATNGFDKTPRPETLHIGGNPGFDFDDWCRPVWDDTNWIDSFFVWRRIDDPERYFRSDFGRIVPNASEFVFRDAVAQGISAQDFAKIVVTVAHFVERAASGYPATYQEPGPSDCFYPDARKEFRPVPLGEIFAVLGTNAGEDAYSPLLRGTLCVSPPVVLEGGHVLRKTDDGQYVLPVSDFQAHSRFLVLALSFLTEVGVLHIDVRSYNENDTAYELDDKIPYDQRVHGVAALIYRYDPDTEHTYCFRPQSGFQHVAWRALVHTVRFLADSLNFSVLSSPGLTSPEAAISIERSFDYVKYNYWCPVVQRSPNVLPWH